MSGDGDQRSRFGSAYVGKHVCVTGGAGFIGSHVASELLDLGADIAIIDDLSASDGQHLWYLIDTYPARVKFCFASVLEQAALSEAIEGCDLVVHLAAMSSVQRSLEEPERCFEVNATGTLKVCEAARAAGAPRVVLASSSAVYGDDPALPKVETMAADPISPYAASKLAAEGILRGWTRGYGLEGIALRFFNIYGARQPDDSPYSGVVAAFIRAALRGEAPTIYGDGSQTRDFAHVSDVVEALLLAGVADESAVGQVMNIAGGDSVSVLNLAQAVAGAAEEPVPAPTFEDARVGDILHSQADITKARALLGYRPRVDLAQGLARTMAWVKHQARTQPSDPEDSRTPAAAT